MTSPLSILSWNLRHGGGSRNLPRIVLALLEHRPDIIILSEFRTTTGGQIAGTLADHGWTHQLTTAQWTPARRSAQAACPTRPAPNTLFIASRTPVTRRAITLPPVLSPSAELAATRRFAPCCINGLALIAAHIPCDGPDRCAREHIFQCILAGARQWRNEPCIVVGDLNAGRHHLDEQGATFSCTHLLGQLAALGYTDAWRHLNGNSREFSWYSAERAGFRLDHAWISPPLLPHLSACSYDHTLRQDGLSDHSALLLNLQ